MSMGRCAAKRWQVHEAMKKPVFLPPAWKPSWLPSPVYTALLKPHCPPMCGSNPRPCVCKKGAFVSNLLQSSHGCQTNSEAQKTTAPPSGTVGQCSDTSHSHGYFQCHNHSTYSHS